MGAVAVLAALAGRKLRPAAVWAIAALSVLALACWQLWPDAQWAEALFVMSVALTISALIALVTRRLLVAVVLAGALLAILRAASSAKEKVTDLALHAYEFVSFLTSWPAIAALWLNHRFYAAALLAALAATAVLAAIAWRIDGTRLRRRYVLAAVPICAALVWCAAAAKGERWHTEFYSVDNHLGFFFSSWSETVEALLRGQVMEAAARASGAPFTVPASCEPASRPPHIILIHEESVVQPSHFPALSYDRSVDPFFHSHDGKLHRLRVETYGGASWLTEFSVMTGLSAHLSGGLRNFVQSVMTGKVRDTLPQALARCGYRTIAVHPMLRAYLSIGRFLTGVGISEILDAKDQGSKWANDRDRFYFGNALAEIERHIKASNQPIFVFIETMATHGAYDYAYMPEEKVPGGGPGTSPEMHEYLRRLSMAHIDYDAMRADLVRRFPGERFLIVHYGDHQPTATLPLLGLSDSTTIEDVMRSGNEAAFITYYVVDGVGYAPPPLPALDRLAVPYLGTVILEAAGLPLSEVYRERKRLMALCDGRYHDCSARGEILNFHRRLIDSKLMDAL